MGGRGSSSGMRAGVNYSETTLNSRVKDVEKEMNAVGDKMALYARYTAAGGANYDAEKEKEYYRLKNQYEDLRKLQRQYLDRLSEIRKAKEKPEKTHKPFVNSYGEATKRDITSQSYNRQQQKRQKEIMSFIGGKSK